MSDLMIDPNILACLIGIIFTILTCSYMMRQYKKVYIKIRKHTFLNKIHLIKHKSIFED